MKKYFAIFASLALASALNATVVSQWSFEGNLNDTTAIATS